MKALASRNTLIKVTQRGTVEYFSLGPYMKAMRAGAVSAAGEPDVSQSSRGATGIALCPASLKAT
jgi:hypothetical protein